MSVTTASRSLPFPAGDPADPGPYQRGVAQLASQQFPAAIASLRQALRLQPDFAAAHERLGIALARQGQLDDATLHFHTALKLQPDSVATHCNLALAYLQQSNAAEAVTYYRRALRLQPRSADIHVNLGNALRAWASSLRPSRAIRRHCG